MKRFAAAVILASVATLASCEHFQTVSSRERSFTEGVETYYLESGIFEEYKKYVQNDPDLRDASKDIRIQTAEKLKSLIASQRKALSN